MIYLELFLSFMQVGAFSFGGGYAAMPLIQNQVVDIHHWIAMKEFTDLVTIAEMTPGPIAVNAATFVGTRVCGLPGALIATLGCVLPSCIFVTALALIYTKYRKANIVSGVLISLRPAVVAMIASAGITILISAFFRNNMLQFVAGNFNVRGVLLFLLAMTLLRVKKVNPILLMVLCGGMEGLFVYLGRTIF